MAQSNESAQNRVNTYWGNKFVRSERKARESHAGCFTDKWKTLLH